MSTGLKDWLNREYFAIESNAAYSPDQKVQHLICSTAGICGVVAMQPLPFADIFALTPIQCYMGYKIAHVRGIKLSEEESSDALKQVAGAVGMGFLAQQGVIGLYKLGVPFLGGITTFPLVAGMTVGIGKAMDIYFRTKASGRSVSSSDLRQAYELGRQEGRNVGKPKVPTQIDLERSALTPPPDSYDTPVALPQGPWDPEAIRCDIEAARQRQNPEESAGAKCWGFGKYNPEQIARDIEQARQKQNTGEHLCRRQSPEHQSPSLLDKIWSKIEDLAYGQPPEGTSRESWLKGQMAAAANRHKNYEEAPARQESKETAAGPRVAGEKEQPPEWHDWLESSGFWHQK